MEDTLEELTEKFSDINLSDLEDFEKEYCIKMNTAGGLEMKPNVGEPSHRYETNKKKDHFLNIIHPLKILLGKMNINLIMIS